MVIQRRELLDNEEYYLNTFASPILQLKKGYWRGAVGPILFSSEYLPKVQRLGYNRLRVRKLPSNTLENPKGTQPQRVNSPVSTMRPLVRELNIFARAKTQVGFPVGN